MVKPIPASSPPPVISLQSRSGGCIAIPKRTASQLKARIPTGFPMTKPTNTASVTALPISPGNNGKPAFANANSGMMTKPTQGCNANSSRSTGDNVSRAAISATCRVSRSFVSPLPSSLAGCAITRDNTTYNRSSLTQRLDGVIKPSTTPVIVAWIPDASTENQIKPPTRK